MHFLTVSYTQSFKVKEIYENFEKLMMIFQKGCGFNPISGRTPIAFKNLNFRSKKLILNSSALPGYIYMWVTWPLQLFGSQNFSFLSVFVCVAMYSSKSVISNSDSQKCIERLQILKVSRHEIFAANFLSQTMILIAQFLLVIPILQEYFDCSSFGLYLVSFEVILGCICGILLGKVLSTMLPTF